MNNQIKVFHIVDSDREKAIKTAMSALQDFCKQRNVVHFNISEAQVIDPSSPGVSMPGLGGGIGVIPKFEMTLYVLYQAEECDNDESIFVELSTVRPSSSCQSSEISSASISQFKRPR